jgi:hypothetical protein
MTNPLKRRKVVNKSVRQNVRQSVVIHLANAPKKRRQKRRRPPLSSSSKGLEVRHVHLYNTPPVNNNPISQDNREEVRKIQAEMNVLRAERTQINNELQRERIKSASFTENNPLNKSVELPPVTKDVELPPVNKRKVADKEIEDENEDEYEYSDEEETPISNKRKKTEPPFNVGVRTDKIFNPSTGRYIQNTRANRERIYKLSKK